MATDNIDDIVSSEGERQWRDLRGGLKDIVAEMERVSRLSKTITFEIKGVKDFSALNEVLQKANVATVQFDDNLQKMIVLKKQLNGSTKEVIDNLKTYEQAQLAAAKAEETRVKTAKQMNAERTREEKALKDLNNEYETLKRSYKTAADAAKELGVAQGVNSKQFLAAKDAAKKMYEQLLAVEMAVGQGQRAVGQYNQAAFAMQQILRETPAFAYSFSTGIMAISNNIPILVDSLKAASAANRDLVAAGGTAIPIWKTLGKELLSFGGIATILVGVGTIVAAKWKDISGYFKGATDELKQLTATSTENAAKETSNAKVLSDIAKDTSQSMEIRLQAVKKLQSEYPAYLGNMSKEAILAGDTADAMERLNQALLNKSIMEAYTQKVGEQAKEFVTLRDKLRGYEKSLVDLQVREEKAVKNLNQVQYGKGEGAGALVQSLQNQIKATKADISDTIKEIGKVQSAMRKYQDEANKFGGLAAPLLVGNDKTKDPKRNGFSENTPELTGAKELAKAQSELRKQELMEVSHQQKAITDDVKQGINERLIANDVYYATLIEMAHTEGAERAAIELEEINASVQRVADLKKRREEILAGKGSMSGDQKTKALSDISLQLKDEEKKQEAHYINLLGIEQKYDADAEKLIIEATKNRLSINKTGNTEWLKMQEDAFAQEKLKQVESYGIQIEVLKQQYDAKLITRRQYDQKLAALQQQQHIVSLEAEKEYNRRLLENTQLSTEDRTKIQERFNKISEDLANASAKQPKTTKNGSGRITDGVAMLLGGEDFFKASLDQRQRYMQTFYDNVTSMARTAADQLMGIQKARLDEESKELDRKQESIRAGYQFELEVIEVTAQSEADKQNMISQLRGQQEASEAQYEAKKRQIATQQARFQRTAAMASAISNTAVAVTKALAELGPLAAIAVPLIVAAGAAQVAAIASAPIPQYKHGTEHHKGGAFVAGDGGQIEYIQPPDKPGYWSAPTSTLYNEKAGTKVTPLDKYVRNIDVSAGYQPGSVGNTSIAIDYNRIVDGIGEHFANNAELLAIVINRNGYRPQKQPDLREAIREQNSLQGK